MKIAQVKLDLIFRHNSQQLQVFVQREAQKLRARDMLDTIWQRVPALNVGIVLAAGYFFNDKDKPDTTAIADYLDDRYEEDLSSIEAREVLMSGHITPAMVRGRLKQMAERQIKAYDIRADYAHAVAEESRAPTRATPVLRIVGQRKICG